MIGPSTPVTPTRPAPPRNIHGSPRLRSDTLQAAEKTSFFGSGGGSDQEISRQYTIMPKKKFVSEIFFRDVDGDGFLSIYYFSHRCFPICTHTPTPSIHIFQTPE